MNLPFAAPAVSNPLGTLRGLTIFILSTGLLLVLSFQPGPAQAEEVLLDWTDAEVTESFVDPQVLERAPDGRLAVWDRALQRWLIVDPEDSSPPLLDPRRVHRSIASGTRLRTLLGTGTPRGFWDASNNFWAYFAEELNGETIPLRTRVGEPHRYRLPGPVDGIKNVGDRWIVARPDGRLDVRDPYLSDTPLETIDNGMDGDIQDVTEAGDVLIREGNEFVRYRDGDRQDSRRFEPEGRMTADGDTIYYHTENRLVRLNEDFSVELTYRLTGVDRLRDLTIRDNVLYALTDRGLERARLSQQAGGFFISSTRVSPEILIETVSPREVPSDTEESFWLQQTDTGLEGVLRRSDGSSRTFTVEDDVRRTNDEDLPMGLVQARVHEESYWHPDGRFYHYFEDDGVVEAFDREGRLTSAVELNPAEDINRLFGLERPDFLGADSERILFTATAVLPERGPRRVVMVYDHEGTLRRFFPLQHSVSSDGIPVLEEARLVYDGEGGLYRLGEDRIEGYDLWGYPRAVELGLTDPVDLRRIDGALYVLESGPRLVRIDNPHPGALRFGSVPGEPSLTSVYASGGSLFATTFGEEGRILEYDPSDRQFETMLERGREVRHPSLSTDGETLRFWERTADEWRLMGADRVRYRVESLDTTLPRGSMPLPLDGRDEFLVREADGRTPDWSLLEVGEEPVSIESDRPVESLTYIQNVGWIMAVPDPRGTGGTLHRAALIDSDDTTPEAGEELQQNRDQSSETLRLETVEELVGIDEPVRDITAGDEGTLRVTTEPVAGFTRMVSIDPEAPGDTVSLDGPVLRGDVKPLEGATGPERLYVRTGQRKGYLAEWHPDGSPGTGGVQGGFRVSGPVNLRGVPVWIEPGGHLVRLNSRGGFTASNLPTGVVSVRRVSHEHYLESPSPISVDRGTYSRPGTERIRYVENDLLGRGMERLRAGDYRAAEFAFTRFAETRGSGPASRWGRTLADVVRWQEGDEAWLREQLRTGPELLPPDQRWSLARRRLLEDSTDDRLLDHLTEASVGRMLEALRYRRSLTEDTPDEVMERPSFAPYHGIPRVWRQPAND